VFYTQSKKPSGLDLEIDRILIDMRVPQCTDETYDLMTYQLTKLYELKALDRPERVSKDTLAIIAGNIAVALIIVAYEQKSIIATKTGQFLLKAR
jgi:hypothetical protein